MKFYLKKAFFIFVYIILTSFIAMAIAVIKGQTLLKVALLVANMGLFLYIVCMMAYQDGQKALKVRIANDKEREYIVRTGEYRKLNKSEEFAPYKGFLVGFVSCLPLIVILIINLIVSYTNLANTSVADVANYLYFCMGAFANLDPSGVHEAVIYASPYWSLLIVPLIMLANGIFFILGAKKIEKQYQKVKDIHKGIYGE